MAVSAFDSTLYLSLLGDGEIASLFSDEAEITAMIRAEIALAEAEADLGVIPRETAAVIAARCHQLAIDPASLAAALGRDGVLAPALVAKLKAILPPDVANWVHFGATSQDMADLSLVLRLRDVLAIIDARLGGIIEVLAALARAHRATPCLARTRAQAAAPTLLGLRIANWLAPLARLRARLPEICQFALACQLGGATGAHTALGEAGITVMDHLADRLKLSRATPWHSQRDRIEAIAGFMGSLASALGTIGADLLVMAQTEVGEVGFAGAGGSSTLPQKQNPVLAETLVTLARFAAMQVSGLHQAAIHANERDGTAWTLEWLVLPNLVVASGAALLRTGELLRALRVNAECMARNIAETRGLVFAELATFSLVPHLGRDAAGAAVKAAIADTLAGTGTFFEALKARVSVPVDWAAIEDPVRQLGAADALISRILDEASV